MAEEFIQQLTHDNDQFEQQWSTIFQNIHNTLTQFEEENIATDRLKVKVLDALVDFILAEPISQEKPIQTKFIFVELLIKACAESPLPPLVELVRLVRRIVDQENIFNHWYLSSIEQFHFKFGLCQSLRTTESFDLIKTYLESYLKHEFLDEQGNEKIIERWRQYFSQRLFSQLTCDSNKLNTEETMIGVRTTFQQVFRHAVRLHNRSKVWNSVISVFTRTLPNLFDVYIDPADVKLDIELCGIEPICADHVFFVSKAYNKHPEFITNNFPSALFAIEHLLIGNHEREARYFLNEVIIPRLESGIDVEALIQMFIRVLPLIPLEHRDLTCKEVISHMTYYLAKIKCSKKLAPLFFEMAITLLNLHVIQAPSCAAHLLEKNEFYPWKDLSGRLPDLLQSCIAYDNIQINKHFSELDSLTTILRLLGDRAKGLPILYRITHPHALQAISRWTEQKLWPNHAYKMAQNMLDLIDKRQVNVDLCIQFIEALRAECIANEESDAESQKYSIKCGFYTLLASSLTDYIDQLKVLSNDAHKRLARLIDYALSRPLRYENGQQSFEHNIAEKIWSRLCSHLTNEADIRLYEPVAKRFRSLACDEDEIKFFNWSFSFWQIVTMKAPDVAADHLEEFLEDIFDRHQTIFGSILPMLYNKRPDVYHARLDQIIHSLDSDEIGYTCWMANVFALITQERSQLIQTHHVEQLFTSLRKRTGTSMDLYYFFQGLSQIANAQPDLFDPYRFTLLQCVIEWQNVYSMKCVQKYFVASTILHRNDSATKNLTCLIDLLKNNSNLIQDVRSEIFHTCQLIGMIDRQALASKREDLLEFQSISECRGLIDFIDGNKLTEEMQKAIDRTQDEIAQMEKRVIKNEQDLHIVTNTIKEELTVQITHLDTRVNQVDNRLNDITEQVTAQAKEIERIDAKTLSHVPMTWGRDVCKLLNRRSDNDWRLLGKRFGYSTSELRHWSMQADPTMALLNEWFLTHKTDEATYGLVKVLEDIGRSDASKIIRDAVTAAGDLIPDDLPMDIKRLPPVFLSYQWGIQEAVLRLKTHLEEAGYACWMDTGQMGGGDKLFAKIDGGIRGAKVVICCMNTSYAQSDNCSREVHLTVSTGKPLIPLQMEKQKWPPEGALGPIMSEYLFIRFFDRKGNDPNFWPTDKFTELLGQIRYHVAPDPDMISDRYRNWFVPRPNNLIFLQPSNQNSVPSVTDDTPLVVNHPQVMISYQWDRQAHIIALYKRLTQLGYRCWLDIFQMGGGDSLFEKIDTGIRNAKCILACVTPKYILSINCRREMALADALKKSIIPLYLEETSTWPPPGPMSMVFSDRPYIDFRPYKDNLWNSKEFEKVLAILKHDIPEVHPERPRQHLLDMKRPTTAAGIKSDEKKSSGRIKSAPSLPRSQICSLM